jgi:hypothetical protein
VTRRFAGAVLVASAVPLFAGCCSPPSSPWDRPAFAWRDAAPGVVLVVDRASGVAMCTGTVFRSEPVGARFRSYVLTAGHCARDADHPHRWGVAAPARGDEHMPLAAGWLSLEGVAVREATRVLASERDDDMSGWSISLFGDGSTIRWVHDWAILAVDLDAPLPVLPLFGGDPATDVPAGAPVSLVAYHDRVFRDRYGYVFLQSHEHPFAWTGVPPGVAQPGHSGAPIVEDGRVVALLSGYVTDSIGCRLFCGTWATRLTLVSVATIRRDAAAMGWTL